MDKNIEYMLSYQDICFVLNYLYKFEENFNYKTCLSISGNKNQFEIILYNFFKNNSKTLFCILNKNNHWTLLIILKKCINEIFYFDSFGRTLDQTYIQIINIYTKKNFIYLENNKILQEDIYSCGYYCIFFILLFDILLNTEKKNSILYLYKFINNFYNKERFINFRNKYKRIFTK